MRCILSYTCMFILSSLSPFVYSQILNPSLTDPPTPHFYYAFEGDLADYNDTITTTNGELRTGKVLEWGNLLYFWDKATGKKDTYKRLDIQSFAITARTG